MTDLNYWVLAYYHFMEISDPQEEVRKHKKFLSSHDILCRVYISEQGINGQMSASKEDGEKYMNWMRTRSEFEGIVFKIHHYHEHVFPKLTVKYRKQLVAIDAEVNSQKKGEYLDPLRWKKMLEEQQERVLLDVRNEYEWKIGHFDGAELPPCETFRDFRQYADSLREKVDPKKTPVMMYCTGGIRCELYSSILLEKGFEKVYQLEGGIINYGLKEGSSNWLGKLFVFDDRLAVPLDESNTTTIGKCHHCQEPNDTYYNCANMDCNALFLCCRQCLSLFLGCCQDNCKHAKRVRPYQQINHKPFRKKHHYPKNGS